MAQGVEAPGVIGVSLKSKVDLPACKVSPGCQRDQLAIKGLYKVNEAKTASHT